MIKIIGGKLKGRKLHNIKIKNVRPTQARVKKSIMDKIMDFENKSVLDLYAGVGTLGIESISRGSSYVCFVEKNISVVKILKKNLDSLMIENNCKIIRSDVIKYLKNTTDKFDIIFADPPYYKYNFTDFKNIISPLLAKNGIFCFESESKEVKSEVDIAIKNYGNTQVVFWRKD